MGGRGVKNYEKLRDLIYGRPLISSSVLALTLTFFFKRRTDK
jgi:hypothetical protein